MQQFLELVIVWKEARKLAEFCNSVEKEAKCLLDLLISEMLIVEESDCNEFLAPASVVECFLFEINI